MSDNYLLIKLSGVRIPRVSLKNEIGFSYLVFCEIGARSPDNVLSGGAQGPVDLGMRRPERSVESNPPCLINFVMLI